MRYGNNHDLKNETLYFTEQMEDVIPEFETLKDLGVHMNNCANWSTNVMNVTKKSRQKMGWIFRSFHSRNSQFMKHMFKTLVTPHIDYNSQLWMPIVCTEIKKIEKSTAGLFQIYPVILWPNILGTD